MQLSSAIVVGLTMAAAALQAEPTVDKHNVTVYREDERFAGWPANNGIWSWGDEIVVGFTLGYHDNDKVDGHPIDGDKPSHPMQARSLDGGETWKIERPSYLDENGKEPPTTKLDKPIDFTDPDFAMAIRMRGSNHGESKFYVSDDRCHTWQGPYEMPLFGRKGILARTDYIVQGKHDLLAFLTAEKDGGGEGWPFAARTTDGGVTWEFLGWIGEQPGEGGYAIMPSTLRLKNGALFSMIRRRGIIDGEKQWWVEPFLSPDDGHTWYMLDKPVLPNAGNPAHMIRLKDGRIALTYGWRLPPYGVRARISSDEGQTWGDEIILRDDGKGWDLGYPRTVQRSDGKIVTVYYFNDNKSKERHIEATIWDPGPAPSDASASQAKAN